jgi:hypothetical protein
MFRRISLLPSGNSVTNTCCDCDAQGQGIISAKIVSTVHDTLPSCFPNSVTGEKRPRSCSRGSILFFTPMGAYDGSEQKERQQLEIVMREHNL